MTIIYYVYIKHYFRSKKTYIIYISIIRRKKYVDECKN